MNLTSKQNGMPPTSQRRKVLVVDDDEILRTVMAERLTQLGWAVATADDGEAAVAALAKDLPDLAIIDISMPRLDGFGLLRHLRQSPRTIDLPAIVCTSMEDELAVERAYKLGASSFVTKPIQWPQFMHHVQFVMRAGESERALRAARAEALSASQSKSAMFQVLSHELKTPLTALIGLTSVVETKLAGHPEYQVGPELTHVIDAASRLNAVISDIMMLAKALAVNGRSNFDTEMLEDLLDNGVAGLRARAARRGVKLVVRSPNINAAISCDARLIQQALSKLADNAIRFSNDGGTVELWGHVQENGSVILSVKDNGPGLTPQKLRECLKPFVQENMGYARPAEGLGLGLPIAKAIAEAHGGELAIQTSPGKGLLAAIVLPQSLVVRGREAQHA